MGNLTVGFLMFFGYLQIGAFFVPLWQKAYEKPMRAILSFVLFVLVAGYTTLRAEHFAGESPNVIQGNETQTTVSRGKQLVTALSEKFRAMKSYGVNFSVDAGTQQMQGNYAVEGEAYTLNIGTAEVFCDGALRYEIDKQRKEITLDRVDKSSRNILSNPIRAFDFLDSDYTARLLWEHGGEAAICLMPQSGGGKGTITVTLAVQSMLPHELQYNFEGEQIRVKIEKVSPLTRSITRFDRANYPNYEMIDFR